MIILFSGTLVASTVAEFFVTKGWRNVDASQVSTYFFDKFRDQRNKLRTKENKRKARARAQVVGTPPALAVNSPAAAMAGINPAPQASPAAAAAGIQPAAAAAGTARTAVTSPVTANQPTDRGKKRPTVTNAKTSTPKTTAKPAKRAKKKVVQSSSSSDSGDSSNADDSSSGEEEEDDDEALSPIPYTKETKNIIAFRKC